jgi:hypothetical protein
MGLGEAAEERARRRRSGGDRGNSGSGEWVAQLEQHAARGGVVVHRERLKLLGARGKRLEYGAHRATAAARVGRVRARDGGDWLIIARKGRLG